MNIEEKRIVRYRVIAVLFFLIPLGLIVYTSINVFPNFNNDLILLVAGIILTLAFVVLEVTMLIKGGKKPLHIYKIAFNENDTINNVPLIAVSVGSVISTILIVIGSIAHVVNNELKVKLGMLIVITIASYLLVNCIIYFLFVIMLKKRPLTLKDLS